MHPASDRRGDVALGASRAQRLWSPAELLEASGGRLARAGQALLQLQREQGNCHVQRMVAAARQTGRDAPVVQPKPVLGQPGDRYERVAELTAQQVAARRPISGIGRVLDGAPAAAAVDPRVQREIGGARRCGKPLPDGVRRPMEQAYGADFTAVRTHSDARADQLTRSLDALAFTTGRDIFFRRGAYTPASSAGQRLLAHELTHVIQQRGGSPGSPEAERGSTARIQRYLFGPFTCYPSLDAYKAALGGKFKASLVELEESLVAYEMYCPRDERRKGKSANALSPTEAANARPLLTRVLAAIDQALLGEEPLTENERAATEKLRLITQDELTITVKQAAKTFAGQHAEPTDEEREHIKSDPEYLTGWLKRQPFYRQWEWQGAGMCQPAANEIFTRLRGSVFNQDDGGRVKIRAIKAYAPPGLGKQYADYVNHFVTVVNFGAQEFVVDPTMSQFLGSGKPLIAPGPAWADLMRSARAHFGNLRYVEPRSVEWGNFDSVIAALDYAPHPDTAKREARARKAQQREGKSGITSQAMIMFVLILAILAAGGIYYGLGA